MHMIVATEPSAEEIQQAMQEFEILERARIFRECVEEGFCGYCARQTLRLVHTCARLRLSCPCGFKVPPVT